MSATVRRRSPTWPRPAHAAGVDRLLFLGSSCIYPKYAEQPIREDSLLTGALEPTNDAYAVAKIAGIMAVLAARKQYGHRWISAMPTNLYGPGEHFHPENRAPTRRVARSPRAKKHPKQLMALVKY